MRDCETIDLSPAKGEPTPPHGRYELAFRRAGLRFTIASELGTEIAARLQAALPSDISLPSDGGSPGVCYAIAPWHPGLSNTSAPGYRVSRNGALRYLGRSPERLVHWLRADIDELVARCSGARLLLAAAVIDWRGRAILILQHDRSGTSSLAAELVRLGATPYADGLALIDAEGRVIPDTGSAQPPRLIALIVSTTDQPDACWLPRRLRGARAVLPILAGGSPNPIGSEHLLRLSAKIAATALTLQGPCGDAARAAPHILAVLDEWIDDPAQPSAPLAEARSVLTQARNALRRASDPGGQDPGGVRKPTSNILRLPMQE